MSTTTFSGPLRAGPALAAGTVVLTQVYDSGDLSGDIVGNYDALLGTLPAGAQIVDIVVDQVVAGATGTTTVSVGTTSGGAELMPAVVSTAGGRFRGTPTAATQLAWLVSAAANQAIYVRNAVGTGTMSAGRFLVSVMYIQK